MSVKGFGKRATIFWDLSLPYGQIKGITMEVDLLVKLRKVDFIVSITLGVHSRLSPPSRGSKNEEFSALRPNCQAHYRTYFSKA